MKERKVMTTPLGSTHSMWVVSGSLSLVGALISISLQGFKFGINNNIFHIPYVLRLYEDPAFADDAFYQSLRHFVSSIWPSLSLVSNSDNIYVTFLLSHMLSRWMAFAAILIISRHFGVHKVSQLATITFIFAVSPIFQGYSPVGRSGLFINYFTHSEVTFPLLLCAMLLLTTQRPKSAFFVNGIIFNVNAFIGIWSTVACLATALLSTTAAHERVMRLRGFRQLGVAGVINIIAASPTIFWIAQVTLETRGAPPFDYIDYLRVYYPQHSLIETATMSSLLAFSLITLAGFAALRWVKDPGQIWFKLYTSFLGIFLVGAILPTLTANRLLLNLCLLRVDSVICLLAALFVSFITVQFLTIDARSNLARTQPETAILLSSLILGQWHVIALAMLAITGREAGHQKVQSLIAVAMLMLALLFASIGVEAEHWGLSRLVPVGGSLLLLLTAIAAQAPMAAIFSILFISASAGDSMHLALASSTSLLAAYFWPKERSRWLFFAIVVGAASFSAFALATTSSNMTRIVIAMQLIIAVVYFTGMARSVSERLKSLNAGLAVIVCLVIPTVLVQVHPWQQDESKVEWEQAWRDVQRWALGNTAPNAMFLVPLRPEGFQLGARRRVWVDWKQGAGVMWSPSFYAQWYPRYTETRKLRTFDDWMDYGCKSPIDYFVYDQSRERHISSSVNRPIPVYSNAYYSIYVMDTVCNF